MEQASCRIRDTDYRLGNHPPRVPDPGQLQNAPGHQRMSLLLNMMLENDRKARKNSLCNLPFMDGTHQYI
jgi:hypothetical protein